MSKKLKTYAVTWDCPIDATSPLEAAREAWRMMREPDSTANYFTVVDEEGEVSGIDLTVEDEWEDEEEDDSYQRTHELYDDAR